DGAARRPRGAPRHRRGPAGHDRPARDRRLRPAPAARRPPRGPTVPDPHVRRAGRGGPVTPGADGGPATPPDPPATGPLRWEEVAPGAAGKPAEPVVGSGTAPGRTALLAGHGIALAGVAA